MSEYYSSYEFDRKREEDAKSLARQIFAILKVGEAFAMSQEDVAIILEHKGIKFRDYDLDMAWRIVSYWESGYTRVNKCGEWGELRYIRPKTENCNTHGWY